MDNIPALLMAHAHALRLADWGALLGVLIIQSFASFIGMWCYALFTLPGTLAHEVAHYLTALILGGHPSFPSLIPVREAYGWRMGSVRFSSGLLLRVPIALAPLGLLPIGLWWAEGHLPRLAPGMDYALQAWLSGTVISASMPSVQDWKVAAPALILAILAGLLFWLYT